MKRIRFTDEFTDLYIGQLQDYLRNNGIRAEKRTLLKKAREVIRKRKTRTDNVWLFLRRLDEWLTPAELARRKRLEVAREKKRQRDESARAVRAAREQSVTSARLLEEH